MVHRKISVVTVLEVRFCTCPVWQTRNCRSIILGSRIVEMEPYYFCVSVALGSYNFVERASQTRSVINMTWMKVL